MPEGSAVSRRIFEDTAVQSNSIAFPRVYSLAMPAHIPLILRDEAFTEPTEIEVPAGIPTAVIRTQSVTLADLPALFDAGYQRLAALGPVGPGFAVYRGDPQATFDLEIGFPVAGPVDAEGVVAAEFPSGRATALSHLGGFDSLGATWEKLAAAGTPGLSIEVYVTDPSVTAAEDLRTDLLIIY